MVRPVAVQGRAGPALTAVRPVVTLAADRLYFEWHSTS